MRQMQRSTERNQATEVSVSGPQQIFFGWEGLMRVIMELEFGDQYREVADKPEHAPPTSLALP